MKDFHDLYSLIHLGNLDASLTDKAIRLVFNHRKTNLRNLPVAFEGSSLEALEKNWMLYRKKIKPKKDSVRLPESLNDLILNLNQWLEMPIT